MNKVAEFKKISFKQFKKDVNDTSIYRVIDDNYFIELYEDIVIPKRSTDGSAGHDICIPFDINLLPNDTLKVPTGIRCEMKKEWVMLIFPRSSMGIKKGLRILNTIPVIDSDYAYADNEGHIFICIKNESNKVMKLKKGDKIVQGVFVPFGVADNKEINCKRTGGIGSTGN